MRKLALLYCWPLLLLSACAPDPHATMDEVAEEFVKIGLKMGQYDADYVDAYYGPEAWKPEPLAEDRRIYFHAPSYQKAVEELMQHLQTIDTTGLDPMTRARWTMLAKQLTAMKAKVQVLGKEKRFSFEEEAQYLYDAQPPSYPLEHFDSLLNELDQLLPGEGALADRYQAYTKQFVIPQNRIDTVFKVAIREARKRTRERIELPENESFELSYVVGQPWSAYNYYQGGAHSLIQINTELPIYIDRAIDLACHEGYPGHHVYNVLLEQRLLKERGWQEYSIYLLHSPQSLIAEGSANYGIDVAFPGEARLAYEQDVLFPLAGIDPEKATLYYQVQGIMEELNYVNNELARQFFAGQIALHQLIFLLEKYLLYERDRAVQRAKFITRYRAYVINYNWGQDLVAAWVARQGGTADQPKRRWEVFEQLLSRPYVASSLERELP